MQHYDNHTRPVYNASQPVTVVLGITLTKIFDLDERNQVLTTNVWINQVWTDEKLKWNPEIFHGKYGFEIMYYQNTVYLFIVKI